MTCLLFEVRLRVDAALYWDALSQLATKTRRYQEPKIAGAESAKNWSSLGGVGFTPIAGPPVFENNKVLRPDFPGRRRKRRDVDVCRYAPQCFWIQRRLAARMGYDA
jgi:hypothetical protein